MFLGISERNNKKTREGESQGQEEWAGEQIARAALPLSLAPPTQSQEEGDAGLNAGIFFFHAQDNTTSACLWK